MPIAHARCLMPMSMPMRQVLLRCGDASLQTLREREQSALPTAGASQMRDLREQRREPPQRTASPTHCLPNGPMPHA
jgi:hypothetical protein